MTTISATTYSPYYATTPSTAGTGAATSATTTGTSSGSSSATSVTLSDAARAALAQKDFSTVIAETRTALDALLINGTAPRDADLGKLDRRQLFAVASNAGGKFTTDEQAAAKAEQQSRLDAALAGPLAVARVTDDVDGIYAAALTFLDGASTEEKATPAWTTQRAALLDAQKQLAANPDQTPQVDGDIVADYIQRMTAGEAGTTRDFSAVAGDARAALDAQYASAKAAGKQLVFNTVQKTGQPADFSQFDSRSLSAVALNQDGKFSAEESVAAKRQIGQRANAVVLAGLKSATAGDPGSFAKNLVSAYASMSTEERQAAGWTDKLYAAAVASYNTTSKIASMFGDTSSGAGGALSLLDSSSGMSAGTSLADILSQSDG